MRAHNNPSQAHRHTQELSPREVGHLGRFGARLAGTIEGQRAAAEDLFPAILLYAALKLEKFKVFGAERTAALSEDLRLEKALPAQKDRQEFLASYTANKFMAFLRERDPELGQYLDAQSKTSKLFGLFFAHFHGPEAAAAHHEGLNYCLDSAASKQEAISYPRLSVKPREFSPFYRDLLGPHAPQVLHPLVEQLSIWPANEKSPGFQWSVWTRSKSLAQLFSKAEVDPAHPLVAYTFAVRALSFVRHALLDAVWPRYHEIDRRLEKVKGYKLAATPQQWLREYDAPRIMLLLGLAQGAGRAVQVLEKKAFGEFGSNQRAAAKLYNCFIFLNSKPVAVADFRNSSSLVYNLHRKALRAALDGRVDHLARLTLETGLLFPELSGKIVAMLKPNRQIRFELPTSRSIAAYALGYRKKALVGGMQSMPLNLLQTQLKNFSKEVAKLRSDFDALPANQLGRWAEGGLFRTQMAKIISKLEAAETELVEARRKIRREKQPVSLRELEEFKSYVEKYRDVILRCVPSDRFGRDFRRIDKIEFRKGMGEAVSIALGYWVADVNSVPGQGKIVFHHSSWRALIRVAQQLKSGKLVPVSDPEPDRPK